MSWLTRAAERPVPGCPTRYRPPGWGDQGGEIKRLILIFRSRSFVDALAELAYARDESARHRVTLA